MTQSTDLDQTLTQRLLAQLNADKFMNLLRGRTFFCNLPFEGLSLTTLDEISKAAKIVRLERNRSLNLRASDSIYEIISGYVKIYDRPMRPIERKQPNVKNPPALLAWRIPGELLGDFRFIAPDGESDHIVATDKCELLQMPSKLLRKWADHHPQIYINIARNLASKASKTRIRAQILRYGKIDIMIARLFLELLKEREGGDLVEKKGQEWTLVDGASRKDGQGWTLVKGTFILDDIAAFLGYKKEGVRLGFQALMKDGLVDHYESLRSGRYVCHEAGLREYLERENSKETDDTAVM